MSEVVKKGLLSVKRSKNRLTSVSTALNIAAILDLVVTEYCNSLVRESSGLYRGRRGEYLGVLRERSCEILQLQQ